MIIHILGIFFIGIIAMAVGIVLFFATLLIAIGIIYGLILLGIEIIVGFPYWVKRLKKLLA